jgi:hypothetical protein
MFVVFWIRLGINYKKYKFDKIFRFSHGAIVDSVSNLLNEITKVFVFHRTLISKTTCLQIIHDFEDKIIPTI